MTPEDILKTPPRILSDEARRGYFEDGYLGVTSLVNDDWLKRLNSVTASFVETSRAVKPGEKDSRFDLEPGHTAESPRLRRLNSPVELDEVYWDFAQNGPFRDVAVDLLGPDVKFHHSKLNFKWGGGGEEVKWHQDIQFWPHTNYDVLTIGVYLSNVTDNMAPMGVVPGSHAGPLFELYDHADHWTGYIRDGDLPQVATHDAVYLGGPAGSITVHNCRSVHGSPPNTSQQARPLFLCAYSAADAIPITNLTQRASRSETQIAGQPAKWARFDGRPCPLPPDFSRGYRSIFAYQQGE